MNWKDPKKELPGLDKSYRCLAEISVDTDLSTWKGYCDVYFTAISGWKRCETSETVEVIKWISMLEIEKEKKDGCCDQ